MVILKKQSNFAAELKPIHLEMKKIYNLFLLTICLILATATFTACEFDTSPEPDYPSYVTYTISVGYTTFEGSELVLTDIETWIKNNQIIYDTPAKYSTGAPSEFSQQDAEAVKKYDEFVPKAKAFFEEVRGKLNVKAYGSDVNSVKGTFYVFVTRGQGDGRDLKSETINLVYP